MSRYHGSNFLEKNLKKYDKIKKYITDMYNRYNYNNFESFFKTIESRKNIIYTFSKDTENLLTDDKKEIENKFGKFTSQSFKYDMIESIKAESDLIFLLKSFANSKDKKILVLHFTENDLNKINSINYIINNFQKEINNLSDKQIIFLIHKQRNPKLKKNIIPDLIPFIDDNYFQIFIDNLQGKKFDILQIMQKNDEELVKEFIENSNLIEKKIYTILNYIKFNVIYEDKNLNNKNCLDEIYEKIIKQENKYIKELLCINLKKQAKDIKKIIENVFITDIIEVNDVDFFEVITSNLGIYFSKYLLKIIYFSLKDCILSPLLISTHLDLITKEQYIKDMVEEYFEKTEFDGQLPRININANNIIIYNGLELPRSKFYFELLFKYVNDTIVSRYLSNENSLRNLIKEEKIDEITKKYNQNLKTYKKNIKVQIDKLDLLKNIFSQPNEEIKKILLEDYLIFYVIKYIEKKEIKNETNIKILSYLKLIIKIKLSENYEQLYDFNYSQKEFIDIVLFTLGYKEDIYIFLDIFVELQKYCNGNNIEEIVAQILKENKISFEISERNQEYMRQVNIHLFFILESLIRSILIFSINLIKDDIKFFEFFYSLKSIEANLQKINKKYYLYSKEIYGLRNIMRIEEAFQNNHDIFFINYEKIMNNILEHSILYYSENYNELISKIEELLNLLDEIFIEKNDDYLNLLLFIYQSQYRNIYEENCRIKLLEKFFKNEMLLKRSKIFLVEVLKEIKPKYYDDKNGKINKETLINNFMDFNNKKYEKMKNLFNILNNIKSPEFNEILLFFFEGQCQSYFQTILNNHKKEYNQICCNKILLGISLEYLKKSIQYLYENKNNYENNLLKFYAIAYIKTYIFYYVEINYNYYDNVMWEEINRILFGKDEENEVIRNVINIYLWRLYYKKFENFDQFENFDFKRKNISIFDELEIKLLEDKYKPKYIFKNSLINQNILEQYKQLELDYDKDVNFDYNLFNNNFDLFYSFLVNKLISHIFSNNKNNIINQMKNIYNESKNIIKFTNEGNIFYEYLLNYELFREKILKKLSNINISQKDLEILLYSFRFIFSSSQINQDKNFYNNILKQNSNEFIKNNYIPGTYPFQGLYYKAYKEIKKCLQKCPLERGDYICKDCDFFYEVPYCSFPTSLNKCPNNHTIGGTNYKCYKKDIRVFASKGDIDIFVKKYSDYEDYISSFTMITLEELKKNYLDKNEVELKKGFNRIDINDFESDDSIRNNNIITFRVLNFIFYSYLMGSYILGNISEKEIEDYLIIGNFPKNIFGIIKKNWILMENSLKELSIENNQTFFNMLFEGLINIINDLKELDTKEKLFAFEKKLDEYILGKITPKNKAEEINKNYQEINNELLKCDPYSLKEIIIGNYDPSIYNQKIYPDIQYYTVSQIQNYNNFVNKFNSSIENQRKYFLINSLIKINEEPTKNIKLLKNIIQINKLSNLLISLYSYKISREEAKKILLKDKLEEILKSYNEINSVKIETKEKFIKEYIEPFINSWNDIKDKCVQYKCRVLRDIEKGENPLDMSIDLPLSYFLLDDGEENGGMFLASAYEKMIEWQNDFIDIIISENKLSGIHNSYISQLEQEIEIQEASNEHIININEKILKSFNDLIYTTAMRNIFEKNNEDNKINYKNYNDFIYNYEFIEEELGKLILPGIKKFKRDKINFITYLFEGFRAGNSSILVEYNAKYPQRKLKEEEETRIEELVHSNKSNKFNNEIFGNLQILMKLILKENYEPKELIFKIINDLSEYITINEQLKKMFKDAHEYFMDEIFSIDCLVSIFEYFESLCWQDMKQYILQDYHLFIFDKTKKYLKDYFTKNKYNNDKIIDEKNLTTAIRRLICRYIIGSRQEIDIKPESQLKLYIKREDLWPKELIEENNEDKFNNEILMICKDDITIGNCFDLYNFLEGDNFWNEEIEKNKAKEVNMNDNIIIDDNNENEENNDREEYGEEGERNDYEDDDDDNEREEC